LKTRSSGPPGEASSAAQPFQAGLRKPRWSLRLTPLRLYVIAFLLFVGATVAVAVGQFSAGSNVAPLTSIGFSAAAVVLTILAMAIRSG
jgi:hypothetical protein